MLACEACLTAGAGSWATGARRWSRTGLGLSALISCAGRRPAIAGSAGRGLESAEPVEAVGEPLGPWPVLGSAQGDGAGEVDEAAGDGEQPGADGAGHGELADESVGSESGGSTDQVVARTAH